MLTAIFDQRADQFQQRLPSHVTLESFRDAFVQAVQRMPALLEADRSSLFLALQKCADAGLKPDGEEAVITIFGADADDATAQAMQVAKGKRAVFMPMVWGLTKLIRQAGGVKSVSAELIYRGEVAKIILGDTPEFIHERSLDPDFDYSHSNVIGAYAIVRYLDGGIEREWMNRSELARVAAVNPAKKGPRAKWPDQMDRKAPLRRLIKKLPKSKEDRRFEYAMAADDTAEHDIDGTAEEMPPPRTAIAAPSAPKPEPQQQAPKDPAEDPADASLGKRVDIPAAPTAAAGAPAGDSPPVRQGPVEALFYGADEEGEPVMHDGEMTVFTSAMAFVAWLESAAMHSKVPEKLWQANVDTIEEACAHRPPACSTRPTKRASPYDEGNAVLHRDGVHRVARGAAMHSKTPESLAGQHRYDRGSLQDPEAKARANHVTRGSRTTSPRGKSRRPLMTRSPNRSRQSRSRRRRSPALPAGKRSCKIASANLPAARTTPPSRPGCRGTSAPTTARRSRYRLRKGSGRAAPRSRAGRCKIRMPPRRPGWWRKSRPRAT